MGLPEPTFDTRKYREILNEALARIPVHNPEWNNHSASDPGITLLQLFAFMTESLIYRANRIPVRNRLKFLRLLGVALRAPQAARGLVAFNSPRGPLEAVTIAGQTQVFSGKTPFSTENALRALPIESRLYFKRELTGESLAEAEALYTELYASFAEPGKKLAFYETQLYETPVSGSTLGFLDLAKDTVDGLWLGLFARPGDDPDDVRDAIKNEILTLGILPALGDDGCVLYPVGTTREDGRPSLIFEMPNLAAPAELQPAYRRLEPRSDDDPLAHPGVVELELPGGAELSTWTDLDPLESGVGAYPPALEDDNDLERLITWIRIRLPQSSAASESSTTQQSVGISWAGINAATVVQRAHVPAERLPDGTGEPDQAATLTNKPVIESSVVLTVNGEVWERIDDLQAADPEVPSTSPRLASAAIEGASNGAPRPTGSCGAPPAGLPKVNVFTLDPDTGAIGFGSGHHGRRPPRGAIIQVSYDYGGGVAGVVGIGAITKAPAAASGIKVSNPVPTWGGDSGETLEEAEDRVPTFLRHRERLVSIEDFLEITRGTPGVSLGRVEVLSLFHPDLPNQTSEGVVTVMVIPSQDPVQPRAPVPDQLFLETVCAYLEPRRLITTELHVRGPIYVDIFVSIGIEVVPGREQGPVREAVREEIIDFLSPLEGGFEDAGWPLNKAVDAAEIAAAATRVSGVAKVTAIRIGDSGGERTEPIVMTGLQLPHLKSLAVVSGDPPSIEELLGEVGGASGAPAGEELVPAPVVPAEC